MVMGLSQHHKNNELVDYHVSGIEVPPPHHTNAIRHGYNQPLTLETITESDLTLICVKVMYTITLWEPKKYHRKIPPATKLC